MRFAKPYAPRVTPLLTAMVVASGCLALPAVANAGEGSLMGPQPYNFPSRSAQAAAILYENKKNANESSSSSSGTTSIGTVYNNSNTSISATNWQQIEMTLGDNTQGSMTTDSSQTSDGGTATSQSDFLNSQEEELAQ